MNRLADAVLILALAFAILALVIHLQEPTKMEMIINNNPKFQWEDLN